MVQQFGCLNEHQFLDAVAVAMITPGPVVITVAFIGFLVAGLAGAVMASIGIFLPAYIFMVVPAPGSNDIVTIPSSKLSLMEPWRLRRARSPAR